MRKQQLVDAVAAKTGLPKVDALIALEAALKIIKQELTDGGEVTLRGFGTFMPQHRAAKTGRNIKRNLPVEIPAHNVPKFKPAKEFVQSVKTGVPVDEEQLETV